VGGQLAGGERFADGTEGSRLVPVDPFFLLLLKIEKRRDLPNPLFGGTLPSMADLLN
jgi:hypothetical protein